MSRFKEYLEGAVYEKYQKNPGNKALVILATDGQWYFKSFWAAGERVWSGPFETQEDALKYLKKENFNVSYVVDDSGDVKPPRNILFKYKKK